MSIKLMYKTQKGGGTDISQNIDGEIYMCISMTSNFHILSINKIAISLIVTL